jgi:myo-inositol-1(or 4)-monophosphatase
VSPLNDHRTVAIQLARAAGDILRRGWTEPIQRAELKGPTNPVTEIDRQSERLIVDGLHAAFPQAAILAEEGTDLGASVHERWIIDPLDGTVNYLRRLPVVAVSIALEMHGELVLGVVYNPITDELFVGEESRGATLNGAPLRVTRARRVSESVLVSGFPYDAWQTQEDNTLAWRAFIKKALTVRCDGAAALDLCQVACGRYDGYWEKGLAPWDIAAGAVIVREAGGSVGDFQLGPHFLERGEVIAANPALADEIVRVLGGL